MGSFSWVSDVINNKNEGLRCFNCTQLTFVKFGTRINGSRIRQAVHNNQDQKQRDLGEANYRHQSCSVE